MVSQGKDSLEHPTDMCISRLHTGQRSTLTLAALALFAFLTAHEGTLRSAFATGLVDMTAPPPKELGLNWRQVNEIDLAGDGIRLMLRDGQWALSSPTGWAASRPCKKFASVLVFDPQLGLILVARQSFENPVVHEWDLMTSASESMVEIPLRSVVRDAPAVASAPRFPLKEYAWRIKPAFDEQRQIARWGFTAKTNDVTWAAYSWLLFDGIGFTSVLLLSRPNEESIWSNLDARADPPILVQFLSTPTPLRRGDTSGLDAYGTDFLTLFQLSDAVGCSLRVGFGAGY